MSGGVSGGRSVRDAIVEVALDRGGRSLGVEFGLGLALISCLAWAAVIAALDLAPVAGVAGFGVVAAVVGWRVAPLPAVLVAGLCVLFADGFALARDGELDLSPSVAGYAAVACPVCFCLAREGARRRRRQDGIKPPARGVKKPSGPTAGA